MRDFDTLLKGKKIVFLDLDGTVYLGDEIIPGAKKFLTRLSEKGMDYYFLSNNSSRSKKDYVHKLKKLHIRSTEEKIILSTDGLIDYLLEENVKDIYLVGTHSMQDMFVKAGIEVQSQQPRYVVLGYDTELTYEKIRTAALHLQRKVKLLASHPDIVCPTPEGPVPDTGAMLELFYKATGEKPYKIFGKPNPEMVAHVLKKHSVSPEEIIMIGDRIYTDMELANRLNCDFILVLSGETQTSNLHKLKKQPTLTVKSLGHLL